MPDPTVPDAADVLTYKGNPARTGEMPGPGPSGSPTIAWQADTGTPMNAGALVVGGVAFGVAADGLVRAYDLGTGDVRWSVDLGPVFAPPVIAGDLLIVADQAGTVTALASADGTLAWTTTVTGAVNGSPAVVDDRLVVATQLGRAYAFDTASGEVVWQIETGGEVSRSVTATADTVFLGVAGGTVLAVSLADGSEIWRRALEADGQISSPTAAEGMLVLATGLDSADPDGRAVVALDAATGETLWTYRSPIHATIYSPAVVDGVAYVVGHDKLVVALDAATGAVLWSAEQEGEVEAAAMITNGVVYTAVNGLAAIALDAATGETLWEVPIRGVPWGPTVTGGFDLVSTDAGILYAIGSPAE